GTEDGLQGGGVLHGVVVVGGRLERHDNQAGVGGADGVEPCLDLALGDVELEVSHVLAPTGKGRGCCPGPGSAPARRPRPRRRADPALACWPGGRRRRTCPRGTPRWGRLPWRTRWR